MVALPKSIMQELGRSIYPRKSVEFREIKQHFAMNGYGKQKTVKWFQYFMENEIITETEDGRYTCVWW